LTDIEPYEIVAYNTARESENKMHDDAVARKFGFSGGLVPGVDVYAYMTRAPLTLWGKDFLERGVIMGRFLKPVYDGETASVSARRDGETLRIEVHSRAELCASGEASMTTGSAPALASYDEVDLVRDRAPADETSLRAGRLLGIAPLTITQDSLAQYLDDVRETAPLYAAEELCHPGLLTRLFNWALKNNVVLGPWIHVASTAEHFALARAGDTLTVRSRVADNYERKGHRFVDLDGIVVANGETVIARVRHSAIYRPRQVAAA
jgi:acyl dehydratase